MKKYILGTSSLVAILCLLCLQFLPPELFRPKAHAQGASITQLHGYTGLIGQEDINWGSGLPTDQFQVPTQDPSVTVTLTKMPSFAANIASIVKGKWYVAAQAGDQANASVVGTIAWVVAMLNGAIAEVELPTYTYTFISGYTVPSNICLKMQYGAVLSIGSYNLTINGPFPNLQACFVQTGTGKVIFGSAAILPMGGPQPEWWTANAIPGTTNMTTAIVAAQASSAAPIKMGVGPYAFSTLSLAQGGIVGNGQTVLLSTDTGTGNTITLTGNNPYLFRDFTLTAAAGKTSGVLMNFVPTTGENDHSTLSHVVFSGGPTQLKFTAAANWVVDNNCQFAEYTVAGIDVANTNNTDSGDSAIADSMIGTSTTTAAGIIQRSSGGIRISNNKINGGAYGYHALWNAGASTGLNFSNNSIANMTVAAISLARASGSGTLNLPSIHGGEIDNCANGIVVDASGFVNGLDISGVPITLGIVQGSCTSGSPCAAINIGLVNIFHVADAVMGGNNLNYQYGLLIGAGSVGVVGINAYNGVIDYSNSSTGVQLFENTTYANLGTPADGSLQYCSDCAATNPCTGSSTGAFAQRVNGVWVCSSASTPLPLTAAGIDAALGYTPANPANTITLQSSTPGTAQTGNINVTGAVVANGVTLGGGFALSSPITGFVSTTGTVGATDSLLTALDKLDGNTAAKAPTTSPAFTTDIHAASVGGATLGTSALPFSSIYMGGAAGPYSLNLTGTAGTSNKTITFPNSTGHVDVIVTDSTTAGQMLQATATTGIAAYSTPTYPSASATARKILVSDATNFVASTELWPIATTSGNVMVADGTNWVTTTPTGTGTPVFGTSPTITTASITPQSIDCHTGCSPTAVQLSNAIVWNQGQTTANVAITGPTLAAGMNFCMDVGTAQASYYWHYTSTTANVYLDAAGPYTTVGFAAPAVGNGLSCHSFPIAGGLFALRCQTLNGTSTGS